MRRWMQMKLREAAIIPILVLYVLARWLTDGADEHY